MFKIHVQGKQVEKLQKNHCLRSILLSNMNSSALFESYDVQRILSSSNQFNLYKLFKLQSIQSYQEKERKKKPTEQHCDSNDNNINKQVSGHKPKSNFIIFVRYQFIFNNKIGH